MHPVCRMKAPDKLRLAMLYALRYEDTGNLRAVKSRLLDSGLTPEKVDLVDALLQYSGVSCYPPPRMSILPMPVWPFQRARIVRLFSRFELDKLVAELSRFRIYLSSTGAAARGPGLFGQDNLMSKLGKQLTTTLQASLSC